jgi:hypothetical protein
MTIEDYLFIDWYRATFKDNGVPCVKCSKSKIIHCSKAKGEQKKNIGCHKFFRYIQGEKLSNHI